MISRVLFKTEYGFKSSIHDKLSSDKDVLCFEMEAAGLMNHFPCLVIRGICDYSDSHKNILWQGYAAMTAAAYAKDLLGRVAPNKIEAERRLGDVLSDVKTGVEDLKTGIHFDHIISKWLSPPNPSTNYNNALKSRHPGSGKWFLNHAAYSRWKSHAGSFLWLHGIPGCGKTVLSSTIVEGLTSRDSLYFYFDFNDTSKQKFDMTLRSLISQLYDKNQDARACLDSLYSSCSNGSQQPSLTLLSDAFRSMAKKAGEIWLVLDALDECITRNNSATNVHLLITSRPEEDIDTFVRKFASSEDMIPIQHELIGGGIFLSERWRTRPKIQDEIEVSLVEKSNGMFRWASCQLDELEACRGPQDVRNALANLPKTLDETYARIVANIPHRDRPIAARLLQFLCYSERPLTLEEAVDCIAVNISAQRFDPENRIPVPREISGYCSNLVAIGERAGVWNHGGRKIVTEIRLAHYSVREYFVSNRLDRNIAIDLEETTARASIASVCLIYLLPLRPGDSDLKLLPLARYAAKYWTEHARAVNNRQTLVKLMTEFFACPMAFKACHQFIYWTRHHGPYVSRQWY
ncbi:hypothetical protein F5Y09DRAFT_327738 [Xylaria sp. FL1042]|nr:hypothetical protein F5Y09DRAFT_327738 [Xylaria sp. FL1042]